MNGWFGLCAEDRKVLCEETSERLGIAAANVEKDFWVCWSLRELFTLPDWGPQLTFKGGTSLSKAWKLIDRFSEDLDIVIERKFLGFGDAALSRNQVEKLKDVCSRRIKADLHPALRARVAKAMPKDEKWTLDLAGKDVDPDRQTLLFAYPSLFPAKPVYVARAVKIELGARSETEPAHEPSVQPFVVDDAKGALGPSAFKVRTIAARRTFWEKAMLLHEERRKPSGKPLKPGLSRHYYDLWSLIEKGIAAEAAADAGLFERVVQHSRIFFRQNWMDYETLKRGSLRLIPPENRLGEWRRDYDAMRGQMFLSEPPAFDAVLDAARRFETDFNRA